MSASFIRSTICGFQTGRQMKEMPQFFLRKETAYLFPSSLWERDAVFSEQSLQHYNFSTEGVLTAGIMLSFAARTESVSQLWPCPSKFFLVDQSLDRGNALGGWTAFLSSSTCSLENSVTLVQSLRLQCKLCGLFEGQKPTFRICPVHELIETAVIFIFIYIVLNCANKCVNCALALFIFGQLVSEYFGCENYRHDFTILSRESHDRQLVVPSSPPTKPRTSA